MRYCCVMCLQAMSSRKSRRYNSLTTHECNSLEDLSFAVTSLLSLTVIPVVESEICCKVLQEITNSSPVITSEGKREFFSSRERES